MEAAEESTFSRFLRDSPRRLAIFRAIGKASRAQGNEWPLWLPPPLRALVALELTSQPSPKSGDREDTAPERFIVDGTINSISKFFADLPTQPSDPNRYAAEDRVVVDYEIPLSLQDARLFLVAVGRLDPAERVNSLSSLLATLLSGIKTIKGHHSYLTIIENNSEVSSLLARIITVCSHLTILVAYPELQHRLRIHVRQSQTLEIPGFASECDWYRSDRCFMGIFSDW